MGKKRKKPAKVLTQFTKDFLARTKTARARTSYSQAKMGSFLGVDQGTYKNYESDHVMPPRLIPTFCVICRVDVAWLFSMKEEIWEEEVLPDVRPTRGRGGRPKTRQAEGSRPQP